MILRFDYYRHKLIHITVTL